MSSSHRTLAKNMSKASAAVDALMNELDHPCKESIQALRALILSLDARIHEEVKWNAPSFYIADHFATFKLRPLSSIQLVLHTGAKVKANPKQFDVADPQNLLTWPAKDRCVLTLRSPEEAARHREAVAKIVTAWIKQLERNQVDHTA